MFRNSCESRKCPSGSLYVGAAWLSSARVVRCRVKSLNERNPYLQLPAGYAGDSEETAGVKPEEGGDDVKSSWPLYLGLHTSYNATHKGMLTRESTQIPKNVAQFDCRLKFACMKLESLVIVGQHTTVNVFLSLVHTARQATKVGGARSRDANFIEASAEVNSMIGTKS